MLKADITPTLVARLVADQFPRWAGLPVARVALDGWDNTTFRLGDELAVRLPSADAYAAQVEKEDRWLPVLAPQLPVTIPESLAIGHADENFPRPWSIRRWIPGEPANLDPRVDPARLAADVARFLTALHAIDPTGGPPPGAHNFQRGAPVAAYDEQTRRSIEYLADELDARLAREVWEEALASRWDRPPVWVHGDVATSNLLVVDGTLRAVIDFGCCAVGDPACDLVLAWTFLADEARAVFRRGLALDAETWARARGWALWKALITFAQGRREHSDGAAAPRRFGWSGGAPEVIERVLADHTARA